MIQITILEKLNKALSTLKDFEKDSIKEVIGSRAYDEIHDALQSSVDIFELQLKAREERMPKPNIVILSPQEVTDGFSKEEHRGPLPNFDPDYVETRMVHHEPVHTPVLFQKPERPTKGIAVDCGSVNGKNPGIFEFRLVDIETKRIISNVQLPGDSTNNIAEYLALVSGLMYVQTKHLDLPVYSDSRTALAWVKKKKCLTKHPPTDIDQQRMIFIADEFIQKNPSLKGIFWNTVEWGQIDADYGRKNGGNKHPKGTCEKCGVPTFGRYCGDHN